MILAERETALAFSPAPRRTRHGRAGIVIQPGGGVLDRRPVQQLAAQCFGLLLRCAGLRRVFRQQQTRAQQGERGRHDGPRCRNAACPAPGLPKKEATNSARAGRAVCTRSAQNRSNAPSRRYRGARLSCAPIVPGRLGHWSIDAGSVRSSLHTPSIEIQPRMPGQLEACRNEAMQLRRGNILDLIAP